LVCVFVLRTSRRTTTCTRRSWWVRARSRRYCLLTQVFRIFDPDLNDSIAIRKVKKSQGDLEDIAKEKLINEELRKVDNENILKIYDIIDQPDVVWYITEYCSGGSLW
jgi:serine/threonine protein kinase